MYADVTDLLDLRTTQTGEVTLTNPLLLGEVLRREVLRETECHATCGFGTNRLLTRLATKRAKPDSQAFFIDAEWKLNKPPDGTHGTKVYQLATDEGMAYFDSLQLTDLPGSLSSVFPLLCFI